MDTLACSLERAGDARSAFNSPPERTGKKRARGEMAGGFSRLEDSPPFVSERWIVYHNIPARRISYCQGQALIWGAGSAGTRRRAASSPEAGRRAVRLSVCLSFCTVSICVCVRVCLRSRNTRARARTHTLFASPRAAWLGISPRRLFRPVNG